MHSDKPRDGPDHCVRKILLGSISGTSSFLL
jgi:hypothetical protein